MKFIPTKQNELARETSDRRKHNKIAKLRHQDCAICQQKIGLEAKDNL